MPARTARPRLRHVFILLLAALLLLEGRWDDPHTDDDSIHSMCACHTDPGQQDTPNRRRDDRCALLFILLFCYFYFYFYSFGDFYFLFILLRAIGS